MSAAAGIAEARRRFGDRMRSGSIDAATRAHQTTPAVRPDNASLQDTSAQPDLGQGRRSGPKPRGTVASRTDLHAELMRSHRVTFV